MCPEIPQDPAFYARLYALDEHLAQKARADKCPRCGGRLDVRNYPRKLCGGPDDLTKKDRVRLSFCCANQGCRKSVTPFSVRFLGRKVYLGAVVVLACALTHGVTWKRAEEIREKFGVDARTLADWREWWLSKFCKSNFWTAARARFMPSVEENDLPFSLLSRFAGEARDKLVALLQFLSPITSETARECQPV